VATVSRPTDRVAAELLERLAQADSLARGCALVLERIAAEAALERALAVVWTEAMVRVVGHGVPEEAVFGVRHALDAGSPGSFEPLHVAEPVIRPGGDSPSAPFAQTLVIPFAVAALELSGALLLDLPVLDDRAEFAAGVVQRCAPALGRCWQLEDAEARLLRVSRRHDLLNWVMDTLPDPVLLTAPDHSILMANRRAERLFSGADDDSEGRRRAIQINTLLFSSFLTRAVIGDSADPAARELNLADPTDGSDLMFEVLSDPLAPGMAADGAVFSILRDITDLKRAVTELEHQIKRSRLAAHQARRERDQLDAVLENVSDPILVTDDQSNIILMNPEADRLFMVDADAESDSPARRAVQANDTRFTTLISDFLLRTDGRRMVRMELTDPDNAQALPVEVASSKVRDARGEPRAIVSILHDLRQAEENERLTRELRELNADLQQRIRSATEELEERNRRLEWQSFELERAYRLKSEFLASMSHELRTPINVILGYTSLARERIYGELTGRQEEALDKIYTTSQHLLDLINDILDLSRIEAGRMPVHLERVSLADVIRELSATMEPMLLRKRIKFETIVEASLPWLQTDRTKVKQILLNLLSNAIKFTHQGGITVRAGPAPQDGRVRITVEDTGIGIRPDHLEMIFDDFRQVDQSRTREYGGTGLGLSITKKLLTLLGGVISVESEFGKGTRFTVDLPLRTEPSSIDEQVRRAVVDADSAVVHP
jgi:PAS domain S-box-containing protein